VKDNEEENKDKIEEDEEEVVEKEKGWMRWIRKEGGGGDPSLSGRQS